MPSRRPRWCNSGESAKVSRQWARAGWTGPSTLRTGVCEGVPDVAIVETRISVWEALAGRAPGQPLGPADPGLWTAVAERVNPAKARPVLRAGIEESALVSARGVGYAMLRSPDRTKAC